MKCWEVWGNQMERLSKFSPIVGDDLPYNTMALRDVPDGFGFGALVYPDDRPLTYALKDKLNDFATKYFRNHEIVGETLVDWQTYLQCDLLMNIDTMEKMLAVYDDDIAKPTQSRTIKRTYDIADETNISGTDTNSGTVKSNIENMDYDLPIDNPNGQATAKSTSDGTTTNNLTNTSTGKNAYTHKGTETEDWSDVGVAPNYELLNGFLDNNRSYYAVFVSFFENCFDIGECLYV